MRKDKTSWKICTVLNVYWNYQYCIDNRLYSWNKTKRMYGFIYIKEAFLSSFSLSTLSAVTFAMCSKNAFSAFLIGHPCFNKSSSCCFLSNSLVLAAMIFCFSATLIALSLLNKIRSRLVSLSNMSLALVLSNLLHVARDSSSCIKDDVPSAAPTHINLPDSWIWTDVGVIHVLLSICEPTLMEFKAESATLILRIGTWWLWRKSQTSTYLSRWMVFFSVGNSILKTCLPIYSSGEENRYFSRTPSSSSESGNTRLHPHDGRCLEVLTPNLAGSVSNGEEVLGVEWVPVHCHHLALVTPVKLPEYPVISPALGLHPADDHTTLLSANHKLAGDGGLKT